MDMNVTRLTEADFCSGSTSMISAMIIHKDSVKAIVARCQTHGNASCGRTAVHHRA